MVCHTSLDVYKKIYTNVMKEKTTPLTGKLNSKNMLQDFNSVS